MRTTRTRGVGRLRAALLGGLLAAAAATQAEARTLGRVVLSPCDLPGSAAAGRVEAECATLEVPEDPAARDGRIITLKIALVPARAAEPAPDPVFFLAGGPGQSALEAYPAIAGAFARINEKRHVVLVDQRGTGGSNRMSCPNLEKADPAALPASDDLGGIKTLVRECLAALPGDPRFYTTTDAVRDLDAVRQAIGAKEINLVGGSYGTRVAQEYLRRHPGATRSVILDGIAPADLALGNEHARNLETALETIFARCREAEPCREAFGDPRAALRRLQGDLEKASRPVTLADPRTGATVTDTLTLDGLRAVVRILAYQPEMAAVLPLTLHEAAAGRPQSLAAQGRLILSDLSRQITHGMQLSVLCTEDAPFLRADPADSGTVLGDGFVASILAQCEVWPKGALPEDFHRPVESDRPVLLLSGELDPVTPPRYGERVLKGLTKARHLVAPHQGHIVLTRGCMPRLAAKFLDTLDPAGLDAGCIQEMPPVPAFVTHNGWTP